MATGKIINTVDDYEIDFFNKFSDTWWDKEGGMKALHTLNEIRIPYLIECLRTTEILKKEYADTDKPLTGLTCLDIGCGGGILAEALARLGCDLIGLDPGKDLIRVATEHAKLDKNLKVQYLCTSIEEYCPKHKEEYDFIVVPEVLEHVTEKEEFIRCCCSCLKPGGSIFVSAFSKCFFGWLITIVLWEHIMGIVPVGCHDYDKYITSEDTSKLLGANDCETKHAIGMFKNVFTKRWYRTSNLSTVYDVHAVKKNKN